MKVQMMPPALLVWCVLGLQPAFAASATTFTAFGQPGPSMNAAGFATAEVSSSSFFGQANGYEFKGGIGASAFAATSGRSFANVQVVASASLSDTVRVRDTSALPELAAAVFQLDVPIIATGTASASSAGQPSSSGTADYSYSWDVGGFAGSGGLDVRALENGQVTQTVSGGGPARTERVSLFVRSGEAFSVSFFARAAATSTSNVQAPSSGAADFGHTLRWGGVSSLRAWDSSGNLLALPADFRLSMLGTDSEFDYFNAAGPNPYTAGSVPEPTTWALMIAGFGMVGAASRRRMGQPVPAT